MGGRRIISGTLEYLGWGRPWRLLWDGGEFDAAEAFWEVVESLANRRAEHSYSKDGYQLRADPEGGMELRHGGRGQGAGLFKVEGFGFSNVASYLEWALCALNGREVSLSYEPGKLYWIEASPFEAVPEVRYFGESNMARLDPADADAVQRVCKIGQGGDCCIFLTMGGDGFSCAKFSGGMARHLIARKAEGTMNAGRIGNCRLIGREDETAPVAQPGKGD